MSESWIDLDANFSELNDRRPHGVSLRGQDLIVIRFDDRVSVLSGRCPHRGARLVNAKVEGELLVCGSHGWDFRYEDGVSPSSPEDSLRQFIARIDHETDSISIDEADFERWAASHEEIFDPDELMI